MQGDCVTSGKIFSTIESAKSSCSQDGKCAGVTAQSKWATNKFRLCSSISIQAGNNVLGGETIRDVHKKESFSGLYC